MVAVFSEYDPSRLWLALSANWFLARRTMKVFFVSIVKKVSGAQPKQKL